MDFFNNKLTGIQPSNIGDLLSIKYMNMSFNNLGGTIPSNVGQLCNLTLECPLPGELYECKNLITLSLGGNILQNLYLVRYVCYITLRIVSGTKNFLISCLYKPKLRHDLSCSHLFLILKCICIIIA